MQYAYLCLLFLFLLARSLLGNRFERVQLGANAGALGGRSLADHRSRCDAARAIARRRRHQIARREVVIDVDRHGAAHLVLLQIRLAVSKLTVSASGTHIRARLAMEFERLCLKLGGESKSA